MPPYSPDRRLKDLNPNTERRKAAQKKIAPPLRSIGAAASRSQITSKVPLAARHRAKKKKKAAFAERAFDAAGERSLGAIELPELFRRATELTLARDALSDPPNVHVVMFEGFFGGARSENKRSANQSDVNKATFNKSAKPHGQGCVRRKSGGFPWTDGDLLKANYPNERSVRSSGGRCRADKRNCSVAFNKKVDRCRRDVITPS